MKKKALLIGACGKIGQEFRSRIEKLDWVVFTLPRSNSAPDIALFDSLILATDVVVIAISTKDRGEAEYFYMKRALDAGKKVVTAAKGALANFSVELEPHIKNIGFNASCGGGSEILDLITRNERGSISRVTGVVNATLNFILDRVANGTSPEDALAEAIELGFVEPGSHGLLAVFNKEFEDLRNKLTILSNRIWAGNCLTPIRSSSVSEMHLEQSGLERVLSLASTHRYFVDIVPYHVKFENDDCAHFHHGMWTGRAGLIRIDKMPFSTIRVPKAEENCIFIERDATSMVPRCQRYRTGLGAGQVPVVSAMITDLERLTK